MPGEGPAIGQKKSTLLPRLWGRVQAAGLRLRVKHFALAAVALYALSLVPMLLIARYNYASVDDYGYTVGTHAAWVQTGSLWAVLGAAVQECVNAWHTWQGSFVSIFFMSLHPGIFADGAYSLTTALMAGTLTLGVVMVCRSVLGRLFGVDGWTSLLVAMFILFFCIQTPPSSVQGFFWYNGSVYYTFIFSLSLVMFSLLITFVYTGRRGAKIACLAGGCLLAVATGGGNYVTALSTALLLGLMVLLLFVKKNKAWRWMLLPLAVHLGCFALSALAPGNAVRQAGMDVTFTPLRAIEEAFVSVRDLAVAWLNPAMLAALLVILPFLWGAAARARGRFPLPVLVSVVSLGFLAACHCPPLYAMAYLGDGRILNIQYYTFLLVVVFNLFYWAGWAAAKLAAYRRQGLSAPAAAVRYLHRNALPGLLAVAVLFGTCTLFFKTFRGYTSYSALSSLKAGEAARYGAEMRQRLDLYQDPEVAVVEVPPLSVRPRELFFADLSTDPDYWSNILIQNYYGKERVIVVPQDNAEEQDP